MLQIKKNCKERECWSQVRTILWGLCKLICSIKSKHTTAVAILFLLSVCFQSLQLFASPMEMAVGDQIKVSADKSTHHPETNIDEAIGNVVIIHGGETIYGESATFDRNKLTVDVKGNVRYIGGGLTMYGQEMNYDINTKRLTIRNARIVTDGYSVVAEWATKISADVILATDAEYTTCKDCPESWSMYGKKVRITLREYVHIQNALVKSNSVPILYLPYMILPIKKGRQTGFLFPEFSLSFLDGFKYRQPWFWAMNYDKDMTLIPGSMGRRGFANELEYRQALGENRWFEIQSLQANDRYYVPPNIESRPWTVKDNPRDNPSGTHYLRYYGSYEHHFQFKNYLTHHLYFMNAREMDIVSDYYQYISKRLMGSELPFHTFFDLHSSLADMTTEINFNRNLIYGDPNNNPNGFDHQYVQTLPRINLAFTPWPLFYSKIPFFYNASLVVELVYNNFKQNHVDHDETLYLKGTTAEGVEVWDRNKWIRNAHRLEANPYIKWSLGRLGPITFETKIKSENLFYYFPQESSEKRFTKRGTIFVSGAFFEIEKIYNTGYIEEIPVDQIENREEITPEKKDDDKKEKNKRMESKNQQCYKCLEKVPVDEKLFFDSTNTSNFSSSNDKDFMMGGLPKLEGSYVDEKLSIQRGGYRHSILFDVRHYYTANQTYWGNTYFREQIKNGGHFDYLDAPKRLNHEIGSNATRSSPPERNTVVFSVNNRIFKKTPKEFNYNKDGFFVKNNFDYGEIASFNVSQGVTLRTGEPKFVDNLTSLNVSTGFSIGSWGIGASDTHMYKYQAARGEKVQTGRDALSLSVGRGFDIWSFGFTLRYDNMVPVGITPTKTWSITWAATPFDTLKVGGTYDYDLVVREYTKATYFATYSPTNNCWKMEVGYVTVPNTRGEIRFNFYLNFGENTFTSLMQPIGQ
ncbi:MAG: LPS-assembly protein LptD [Oligoflexia bacterium]|nr:LPS-assembly protein LptD [Oligoflexia bacterium]